MTAASALVPKSFLLLPPRAWWAGLLLVLLTVGAYWNSLNVPFLFDDAEAVVRNPTIRQLWPLSGPLSPPAAGGTTTGRPVVNLSFALNYALSGDSVWSYHAVNVLLHAAAALVLMGLVRRTLETPRLRPEFDGAKTGRLALAVAILWALHPLQTESVTGIAQRTEVLCGLFYLLTFYCFARGTTSLSPRRWQAAAVIACLLGMGTKEVMATAPLLLFLYDRTFLAGSFAGAWRVRRNVHLAVAGTWGLLGWLVFGGGGTRGASAGLGLGVDWWAYLLKQCEALLLYLKLLVWPHPLVLDYGTAVTHSLTEVLWPGIGVLILLGGTGWALWRRPVIGFLGAWFFVILAPSSSVIPLVSQTMAEHRMYLPLAAVVVLAVVGLRRVTKAGFIPSVGALGFACLVLTIVRNHDYRSAHAIWSDTVAKWPSSARARLNLGVELRQGGELEAAISQFARAASLQRDYVSAHFQWGAALLEQGRVEAAIGQLQTAVRLGPGHADAHLILGNALVQAGRTAEAVVHFENSLTLQPAADAHYNLGLAWTELGRMDAAERQFRAALVLDPGMVLAQRRLGMLLAQGGRLAEASEQFEAIIRIQPDDADARANLGNVRLLQGRTGEAITHYETALRLRPGDARLQENLELARRAAR
jgi:Tfp pilus assembly protein PilF